MRLLKAFGIALVVLILAIGFAAALLYLISILFPYIGIATIAVIPAVLILIVGTIIAYDILDIYGR